MIVPYTGGGGGGVTPASPAASIIALDGSPGAEYADYLCSGEDDHIEFNAAIAALLAGNELVVLPGDYAGSRIETKSGLNMRGVGGVTYTRDSAIAAIYGGGKHGINISGMKFDGGGFNSSTVDFQNCSNLLFDRIEVQNSMTDGALKLWGCSDSLVKQCRVHDNGLYGIILSGAVNNITVYDNYAYNNVYAGIEMMPSSSGGYRNVFLANKCWDNTHGGIICNGANPVEGNLFAANVCWRNSVMGQIYLAYDGCRHNVIHGNSCTDGIGNNAPGCHIYQGKFNTIIGNTCTGSADCGIYLEAAADRNSIIGNICKNNAEHGIYTNSSYRNDIIGNEVHDNAQHGIYVLVSDRNKIAHNTVTGSGASTENRYGLYLANVSYARITGNRFERNHRNGIDTFNAQHCWFDGNDIIENGLAQPDYYFGIRMQNSDYNLLTENHYNKGADVQRFGLYFYSGSTHNLSDRDWFDDAGTDGAHIDYGTDNAIRNQVAMP